MAAFAPQPKATTGKEYSWPVPQLQTFYRIAPYLDEKVGMSPPPVLPNAALLMKMIFSYPFVQGNEDTGLGSFNAAAQEKILANVREITGLVSHIGCQEHPYVVVPITTARAGGEIHNTFFVCCPQCKEILTRALSYGRARFRVVCLLQNQSVPVLQPQP